MYISLQLFKKRQSEENAENDQNFKDLPEYEEEEYFGEGIKKIKAYYCDIHLEKLNLLRQNFWGNFIKLNNLNKILQ